MTDGGDLAQLREALFGTAAIDDPTERLLEVAAIIGEAFADLGVQPVVVGGLALAYWSDSAFLTGDIDVVMPRLPELSARLEVLGFERKDASGCCPVTTWPSKLPERRSSRVTRPSPRNSPADGRSWCSRSRICSSGVFANGFTGAP